LERDRANADVALQLTNVVVADIDHALSSSRSVKILDPHDPPPSIDPGSRLAPAARARSWNVIRINRGHGLATLTKSSSGMISLAGRSVTARRIESWPTKDPANRRTFSVVLLLRRIDAW
jgi:hypothetical protein